MEEDIEDQKKEAEEKKLIEMVNYLHLEEHTLLTKLFLFMTMHVMP